MIKLVTLNIEGNRHLQEVIDFLRTEDADVICLQEVFAVDVPLLEKAVDYKATFVPMANVTGLNKAGFDPRGEWGLVWMSRLEHQPVQVAYYHGGHNKKNNQKELPVLGQNPNVIDRVLVWSEVEKDHQKYRIATTHFTWTPDGQINDDQKRDFAVLAEMIKDLDKLVLCGDFNAPRGREMFSRFEELLIDHLPQGITSTLDPVLFRKGKNLKLVVDTIFSTPHYLVTGVKTVSGVSDHQAVVGMIQLNHDFKDSEDENFQEY